MEKGRCERRMGRERVEAEQGVRRNREATRERWKGRQEREDRRREGGEEGAREEGEE